MCPSMIRGLLKLAMLNNRGAMSGHVPSGREWETETFYRIVLVSQGIETDVVFDKITEVYRIWIDGVELGKPEWN